MTLIYDLDLDIPKIPKINFLDQGFQKLEHYKQTHTDRQTDRQTDATGYITTTEFAGVKQNNFMQNKHMQWSKSKPRGTSVKHLTKICRGSHATR